MNKNPVILDSSVWIEVLGDRPLARSCQKEIDQAQKIFVPTTVMYEVYRKICSLLAEDQALSAIAVMNQYETLDLTRDVALTAADLSLQYKIGMADSFVLAHAQSIDGVLITLDNDFSGISFAKVIRK